MPEPLDPNRLPATHVVARAVEQRRKDLCSRLAVLASMKRLIRDPGYGHRVQAEMEALSSELAAADRVSSVPAPKSLCRYLQQELDQLRQRRAATPPDMNLGPKS